MEQQEQQLNDLDNPNNLNPTIIVHDNQTNSSKHITQEILQSKPQLDTETLLIMDYSSHMNILKSIMAIQLDQLRFLELTNCHICSLEEFRYIYLPNVYMLNLHTNKLRTTRGLFLGNGIPKLETLMFSYNKIDDLRQSKISRGNFKSLSTYECQSTIYHIAELAKAPKNCELEYTTQSEETLEMNQKFISRMSEQCYCDVYNNF